MILLDSDHLSILIDERDRRHARLVARLQAADDSLAIPIVVIEEHLRGWLARLHRTNEARRLVPFYERLERFSRFLSEWEIASWTPRSADRYDALRARRVRIGTKDLRIAAVALEHDAVLLSANLRDFECVPGLRVEDWLADWPQQQSETRPGANKAFSIRRHFAAGQIRDLLLPVPLRCTGGYRPTPLSRLDSSLRSTTSGRRTLRRSPVLD